MTPMHCPMPNTCLAACLAMILNTPIEKIFERMPSVDPHMVVDNAGNRRGYTMQDIILGCEPFGSGFIPYDFVWRSQYGFQLNSVEEVLKIMKGREGILAGILITSDGVKESAKGHALAWDGQYVHDPRDRELRQLDLLNLPFTFQFSTFWRFVRSI